MNIYINKTNLDSLKCHFCILSGNSTENWRIHKDNTFQDYIFTTHLQHIYTYHRQVTVGIMTRTVRQASNNEEIEVEVVSSQYSCNSHCSFDRAMRVEKTLMQTLACQLSSTLILVWSRLCIALHHIILPLLSNLDQQFNSNPKYALHFIPLLKSIIYIYSI